MGTSTATARAPLFRVSIHRAAGCYIARVANLPGCFSRGASEVEAVENARLAIRAYLRVAEALAEDPPTVVVDITA